MQQNGAKTFKETCTNTLTDIVLIRQLVDVLYSVGCLQNVLYLVKYIAVGTMSSLNIAFLLCLDVAKFHSCVTCTVMHFRKEMKQFWEIVYRVCKGKGLRLFSGSKNRGTVINKTTSKGNFCPEHSRINFACLDEKSLVNNCCNLPQIIKPGILKPALRLLDKTKKYVISIDGKKIDTGDINLWGHKYPNLEDAKKKRDADLKFVDEIDENITEGLCDKGLKMLPNLLLKISGYISRIRNIEIGYRKLLTRLEKLHVNNPEKSKDYELVWILSRLIYSQLLTG